MSMGLPIGWRRPHLTPDESILQPCFPAKGDVLAIMDSIFRKCVLYLFKHS